MWFVTENVCLFSNLLLSIWGNASKSPKTTRSLSQGLTGKELRGVPKGNQAGERVEESLMRVSSRNKGHCTARCPKGRITMVKKVANKAPSQSRGMSYTGEEGTRLVNS